MNWFINNYYLVLKLLDFGKFKVNVQEDVICFNGLLLMDCAFFLHPLMFNGVNKLLRASFTRTLIQKPHLLNMPSVVTYEC